MMESPTYEPQTTAGKRGMSTVADAMEMGIDLTRLPFAMLGGVIDMGREGPERANQTFNEVMERGIGTTYGERTLEATDSPLAATAVQILPEASAEALGAKGGLSAARRSVETVESGLPAVIESTSTALQTPRRRAITSDIQRGSTDRNTAGFRLTEAKTGSDLPDYMLEQNRRAVKDPFQKEAIRQGYDSAVVASIRGASPSDRAAMDKMLGIMERARSNAVEGMRARPGMVIGDALLDRFKVVLDANRRSGSEIDSVANSLKGQPIDVSSAVDSFGKALDDLGVEIIVGDDGVRRANFDLSVLAPGDRGPIREVIRQMNVQGRGGIDAFTAHRMKRIIDNNVTFGKSKTGMGGDAERAMKDFRFQLDEALDSTYPEYNRVNTTYSETIGAINDFQQVSGRSLELDGPMANSIVGQNLRGLMSNNKSRQALSNSVDAISELAVKYGAEFDTNIDNLLVFADELDKVHKPIARTGFQGQIGQALSREIPRSGMDVVTRAGDAAINAIRGVDEDSAFKAMRSLLRSF